MIYSLTVLGKKKCFSESNFLIFVPNRFAMLNIFYQSFCNNEHVIKRTYDTICFKFFIFVYTMLFTIKIWNYFRQQYDISQ